MKRIHHRLHSSLKYLLCWVGTRYLNTDLATEFQIYSGLAYLVRGSEWRRSPRAVGSPEPLSYRLLLMLQLAFTVHCSVHCLCIALSLQNLQFFCDTHSRQLSFVWRHLKWKPSKQTITPPWPYCFVSVGWDSVRTVWLVVMLLIRLTLLQCSWH